MLDGFHLEKYLAKLTSHLRKERKEEVLEEMRETIREKTKKEFKEQVERQKKEMPEEEEEKELLSSAQMIHSEKNRHGDVGKYLESISHSVSEQVKKMAYFNKHICEL